MATGTIALETLRGAIEVAEADAATPTRLLYQGPPGAIDDSGVQNREAIEDRRAWAKRTGLANVYSGIESSTLRITGMPASYEAVGWWLTALAPTGGGVPGTVDTSAYERTYTPVEDNTLGTYGTGFYSLNLEWSTSDLASTIVRKMPAMRITDFTLNFSKRASGVDTGATIDVELMMAQGTVTNGTAFAGSLSDYTSTPIIGNALVSTIDPTTIGTTADTNVSVARFNLSLPLSHHDGMDGNQGHTSGHYAQQWIPTLTVTRKFSDLTELNAYLADTRTERKIRIASPGAVVGAATAVNDLRLDFYGVGMAPPRRTEIDGIWYLEHDLEGIYDSTATSSWTAFLRNSVAAAYTAT